MFGLFRRATVNDELATIIETTVRRTVEDVNKKAAAQFRNVSDLQGQVTTLREQLETLRIEKGRKEEDFARKEREIEHKVGLAGPSRG